MSKKKGGSTYLADIVSSVSAFGIMFVVITIVTLTSFFLDYGVRGTVYAGMLYNSPVTENILINYLDATVGGKNIGDLIAMAVWKGEVVYELEGKEINLIEISRELLNDLSAGPRKLTLEIEGNTIVLDEIKGSYKNRAFVIITAGERRGKLVLER